MDCDGGVALQQVFHLSVYECSYLVQGDVCCHDVLLIAPKAVIAPLSIVISFSVFPGYSA